MIRRTIIMWLLTRTLFTVQTTVGRDWQIELMGNAAALVGLSTLDAEPSTSDTVLDGEINSGTMARERAVFSHTSGTSSYALTRVITADAPVTLHRIGVFSDSGVLVFTRKFAEPAELAPGDRVQITHTVSVDA